MLRLGEQELVLEREGYNKNKYLVSVPSSWHRLPKMLRLYCPLYAHEMTHGEALDSFRMGLVSQKNQPQD